MKKDYDDGRKGITLTQSKKKKRKEETEVVTKWRTKQSPEVGTEAGVNSVPCP